MRGCIFSLITGIGIDWTTGICFILMPFYFKNVILRRQQVDFMMSCFVIR